ncbi:hypothetical protein [Pseudomonas xionganensis]|uniref:Uncharacterized protein n=1 Tax=Pseudomonas xionganensis TaxID=2654845 RepID=A0A6I4L017_9PSED|nr:hypothetical protein [Pseudomonas xionganensis]MVW75353.1 hypothetical protein [Pseudomonas xionganensis]
MNGLSTSATQRRIEQQCLQRQRYRHKPTGRRYVLNLEAGGTCELQGLDGRCTYVQRQHLDNTEVWERLP